MRDFPTAGQEALWARLIQYAKEELVRASPAEVQQLVRVATLGGADEAIAFARSRGIRLDKAMLRVLEAGTSVLQSTQLLTWAGEVVDGFLEQEPEELDPRRVDGMLDLWWIYLDRLLGVTEKYVERLAKCFGGSVPEMYQVLKDAQTWKRERSKAIATGRQVVAHGNTTYIRAIDEDGLWEPSILAGASGFETLGPLLTPTTDVISRRLIAWAGTSDVTRRAVVEGDHLCARAATLLVRISPLEAS